MGGACALALCTSAVAQTRSFNIPPGELRAALAAFARQAGVQLIYRVDDLRGARTSGVRGALTADEALNRMLRGTGLRIRRDASGAIAIVRADAPPPPLPPPPPPPPPPRSRPAPPVFVDPEGQPIDPEDETEVESLIVTGSRLPSPNLTSVRPVIAVTSQDIRLEGAVRVEDVLNGLPQAFAGQGSEVSNGATGIATVDLRGLGSSRTLVLIDGRRMVPGDPTLPVADLNFVPAQMVDRIDVVTGGASAVYGADAVAGVVNFIMIKNFEGVRLDAQYGAYQHGNDSVIGDLVRQRGFPTPPDSVWDGGVIDLTGVIGVSSAEGRGNATFYATWRKTDPINLSQRDFSSCSLQEPATTDDFFCSGSGTTSPARVISFRRLEAGLPFDLIVSNGGFRRFSNVTDAFNFAPFNYFQRPDERFTLGGFAHYELNKAADVYTQLMFMDDRTEAALAPSGIFGQTVTLPCDSPLLSPAQIGALCTEVGLGPGDAAEVLLFRRNVEGDTRRDDLRHTAYRLVAGIRGDLGRGWGYDLYGQYSTVAFSQIFRNDFSLGRSRLALDVVRDPVTGQLVCRSELDASTPVNMRGCTPYEIFSPGGPSAAAVDYLQTPGFANGLTTEQVVSAQVTGRLGEYGVKSPWTNEGVAIALGAEYRRERLRVSYGAEFLTGDLAGQGGTAVNVDGGFDVVELFGEVRLPIVEDRPWLADLSLEAGFRHADYSTFGAADTYKVTLTWAPVADLRLRGGYNRAVRAPNILELFTPPVIVAGLQNDPCAGPDPQFTPAQCANTGVSAAQYGRVPASDLSLYNSLSGGNPTLGPETADSWSAGLVATPRFLPGFNASIDYFDIKVSDAIGILNPDFVLEVCATTGDPALCSRVHRDPDNGSLFTAGGFVEDLRVNVGHVRTSGFDLEANYRPPLAEWGVDGIGDFDVSFLGSWLSRLETAPGVPAASDPTVTSFDCVGLYGAGACGPPSPRWRHRLRLTWTTPVDGLSVSAAWRYFGGVTNQNIGSDNPYFDSTLEAPASARLGAQSYLDIAATWRLMDSFTLRAGVNNALDRDPPLVGQSLGGTDFRFNGNTYPAIYQALGRFIFVGVTADF